MSQKKSEILNETLKKRLSTKKSSPTKYKTLTQDQFKVIPASCVRYTEEKKYFKQMKK